MVHRPEPRPARGEVMWRTAEVEKVRTNDVALEHLVADHHVLPGETHLDQEVNRLGGHAVGIGCEPRPGEEERKGVGVLVEHLVHGFDAVRKAGSRGITAQRNVEHESDHAVHHSVRQRAEGLEVPVDGGGVHPELFAEGLGGQVPRSMLVHTLERRRHIVVRREPTLSPHAAECTTQPLCRRNARERREPSPP